MIAALVTNTRYRTRNFIGGQPLLFHLLKVNKTFRRRMVKPGVDICIEGFPRSSNSFAYHAFKIFNPDAWIAHHIHVPVQVLRALDLDVPCVVLVREPLDALSSLLIVDGRLRDSVAIRSYVRFYRRIVDRVSEYAVAEFREVVEDFPGVVERVNRRYGTAFAGGPITGEIASRIRDTLERVHEEGGQPANLLAVPTEAKETEKQAVRARIASHPLLAEADRLYEVFLAARETELAALSRAVGPPRGPVA